MRKIHFILGFISYFTLNWLTFKFYTLFNEQNPVKSIKSVNNEDNVLLIYNKIPKTGSTSFVHFTQHLSEENGFKMVLLNISHPHSMTLSDRQYFAKNISTWQEMFPAIYHGHFAYVDMQNLAVNTGDVKMVNINIVRNPFERMISYYYFLRYGDDFRKNKVRSRMSDKNTTFDECVKKGLPDCQLKKLWYQVPWFCGHFRRCWDPPGNRWALEQAKFNLANKYFLVGLTEELETFIDLMEMALPRFFKGARSLLNRSSIDTWHIRRTKHKDPANEETINAFSSTRIWKAEMEFYEFAKSHFLKLKDEWTKFKGKRIYHYEKVRP